VAHNSLDAKTSTNRYYLLHKVYITETTAEGRKHLIKRNIGEEKVFKENRCQISLLVIPQE
jgi:hypothetical protein